MAVVTVVNECVPEYRAPLWSGLRDSLAGHGLSLRLLHGPAHGSFAHRKNTVRLPWAEEVPMRSFTLRGKELVYLDVGDTLRTSDLVITTQEIRLLHNFRLSAQRMLGRGRLAFMGHGRDQFKQGRATLSERIKIALSRRVDWWFVYNEYSRRMVEDFGYPPDRITAFMNSTDTRALRTMGAVTTREDLEQLRRERGLGSGPIGIYVGSLDHVKQIRYLVQAARRIHALVPGFELMIVGGGEEGPALRQETAQDRFIHWVPPQFDESKVRHMMLAEVFLLPAWVGLAAVDAFAMGLPLLTTDRFPHSVEIDYLRHGVNSWISRGAPEADRYGEEVSRLLADPARLASLRAGARGAGDRFSVETMVERFTSGILGALARPPLHGAGR